MWIKKTITSALFIVALLWHAEANAVCAGTPLNPITGIAWQCIFPIKIAGIPLGKNPGIPDVADPSSSPICACPFPPPIFIRPGITFSMWEPTYMLETVKDPFCIPSLGMSLGGISSGGKLGGSAMADGQRVFSQVHSYIFPVWAILGLFIDTVCVEHGDFAMAYMTEIDPLWQDDTLAMYLNPEVLLFANPVAGMACMADAATSLVGLPLDPLFWCMGGWGSAYPLTGHISNSNIVEASAGIAARMLYKQSRMLLIWDCALNWCACLPAPIWVKSHFRLQIAKPVRQASCTPIGKDGTLWASMKNIPYVGDNFLWMVFKKRTCCAF